jgi:CRP/FNR family transcriptional regulator, cyclic AMP receptor protein
MTPVKTSKKLRQFDTKTFLSTINGGRKIEAFPKKQTIFGQGDLSDAVFYIQEGRVRLTVVLKSVSFGKTMRPQFLQINRP